MRNNTPMIIALGAPDAKETMIYLDLDANERAWTNTTELLAAVQRQIVEASALCKKDYEDPRLPKLRLLARDIGDDRHKLNAKRVKLLKELAALQEVA